MCEDLRILSSSRPFIGAALDALASCPDVEHIFVQSYHSNRADGRYDYCTIDVDLAGPKQTSAASDPEVARVLNARAWRLPHLIPFNTNRAQGPLETMEMMIDRQICSLTIQTIDAGYDRLILWRNDDMTRIRKRLSAWLSLDVDLTAHRRLELARHPDRALRMLNLPPDVVHHFRPIGINMIDECFAIIDLDPTVDILPNGLSAGQNPSPA
jgi:hypothetical protein